MVYPLILKRLFVPEMNEKRALAESEAGEGPATKKSRAETHAHPLLMLPLDIFSEQVLVFCERKEVATIMAIPLIREHFRLDKTFCPTHGTRLNKEDESSVLECIDCVMKERNHFRGDLCDDFHDEVELHNGKCGKVICGECKYYASCRECEKDFHFDCASCGMVTFCGSCDTVCCGTCQQLKTCDGCNVDVACRECREERWIGCNTCDKKYCEPCFYDHDMFKVCDHCENIYCQDCGCVETCRYCEDSICKSCRSQLEICSVCGDNSCSDNYLRFASCSECEKCFCSDCDKGQHSYKSENALCTSCYTKAK